MIKAEIDINFLANGVRGREPAMWRKVYINLCVNLATAKINHYAI